VILTDIIGLTAAIISLVASVIPFLKKASNVAATSCDVSFLKKLI
jgi:ABC-type methionine transport system permease subunit